MCYINWLLLAIIFVVVGARNVTIQSSLAAALSRCSTALSRRSAAALLDDDDDTSGNDEDDDWGDDDEGSSSSIVHTKKITGSFTMCRS